MDVETNPEMCLSDHDDDDISLDHDLRTEITVIKERLNIISQNQRLIMNRQEDLVNMFRETNILLRRHMGLPMKTMEKRFPLKCENDLKTLNEELCGEKRSQIIVTLKKLLGGKLRNNMERIFHFDIIMSYNYDGAKGKKPLKTYEHLMKALFEANCSEGETYKQFINEMRTTLRILKNRCNKQASRNKSRTLKNDNESSTSSTSNNQNATTTSSIYLKNNNHATLSCVICAEDCGTQDDLNLHMKTHDVLEVSTKVCQICWRTFNSPMSLQFHMQSHKSSNTAKHKESPVENESLNIPSNSSQLQRKTCIRNVATITDNCKSSYMTEAELGFEFVVPEVEFSDDGDMMT